MNVLQESRVIQLNKMIGLSPKAKPSTEEVMLICQTSNRDRHMEKGSVCAIIFTLDHSQTAS